MNLNIEVLKFIEKVDNFRDEYYKKHYPNITPIPKITFTEGSKFIKLLDESGSCWGFISKVDCNYKGAPIKVGDLMKGASWSSPAKHSRGSIIDGTASFSVYGPTYIK